MKKTGRILATVITAMLFFNQLYAGVDPTTAWWNNEDFEGYELGTDLKTEEGGWTNATGVGGSPYVKIQQVDGNKVFGVNGNSDTGETFGPGSGNGPRGVQKIFEQALSGLVYVKTRMYHGTYGTDYILIDAENTEVFKFGGVNPNSGTAASVYFTESGDARFGDPRNTWSNIEFVLDLTGNKIIKIAVNDTELTDYADKTITTTHAGNIKQLKIILGKEGLGGFDNTTFGQLVADTIKNLAGAETLQAMVDNPVSSEYTVTTFSYIMGSDFDIPKADMDVVWSISDYGTLSDEDKALVSLVRNETDFSKATLNAGSISADATIRLQAQFGNAVLTKDVELKAPSIEALKATLQEEINKAKALLGAVTDNNSFIAGLKSTLETVISSAEALIEDENATLSAMGESITALREAESAFSDAIAPYNAFVDYIATVQAAHDAEVRDAAFFTAIKSALQTAITAATGARTTIASADDITAAKNALEAALTQFNTDAPAYASLESAIATVTARITAVTPRIGTKFLNYRQDKVTELTTAKTTAETALATAETVTALTEAVEVLNSALATFNETGRIAPGTGSYKIYTYGVAGSDGDDVKKVIFSDLSENQENYILKYSDSEEEAVNTEWIITQTAPNVYTIKNKTLPGNWYIAGAILTSDASNLTISENTGEGGEIYKDEGYFLYGILTSSNKALEVAADGVMKASNTMAPRFRFAFQFEEIAVTGVTLNKTAETLNIGKTLSLKATVDPANATNPAVTWSTSDEAVATVSETGTVTAVSVGAATITVTTEDGDFTATCEITVTPIAVTGVILDKTAETLETGATLLLTATVAPADATNPAVTWSTSDEAIATVSETGLVTAVAKGTATITVTTEDGGFTATCEITISNVGIDKIQAGTLNVYPNPVKDKLYIQSEVPVQSATVFHIGGIPVKQVNSEVSSIDMQDLSAGLYLVKLVTEQGDIWIKTMKK
ncbi:MAG: Ig-like domain-containing protein [Dysgonamonadaceae bacterium]|nr:Ig-like domain-containing protein [Dysgonamonadaceae bacterium]